MDIQVKSSNGITLVPLETRLLTNRQIFLEGEIDSKSSCDFTKQIILLTKESTSAPIQVIINSPGGEVNSGLLIYDVIQTCHTPIQMYCFGRAYSMAAVLFASGRFGRYMLPHAELMLHEPLLSERIRGNSSSIKSISDSLIETRKKLNRILSTHTGRSEEEIKAATSYDHYYSAEESIAFGLCDKKVFFDEIMEGNI